MGYDLHTHSTFSDGTDAPAQIASQVAASGLAGFALTDHDSMDGLAQARVAASDHGVGFLPGLEFSTELGGESIHLLGYGCRRDDEPLAHELERVRNGRDHRTPTMLAKLAGLGMPLTEADVAAFAANASAIGRPHVADAMVARGYVRDRDEAFARWLGDDRPGYVDRYATPLRQAIGLVRDAGGVAVIAHAWSRRGRHVLPPRVLGELLGGGLDGVEVDHPDHTPSERRQLWELAHEHSALTTGSSDFHGTGKKQGFGLGACTTDAATWEALRELIASRGGVAD